MKLKIIYKYIDYFCSFAKLVFSYFANLFEKMQLFQPNIVPIVFNLPDAEIVLYEKFFDAKESLDYYNLLKNSILWKQDQIKIFGKDVNIPRLQAWYGDYDKQYSYSGITMQPLPWTHELLSIKQRVENESNTSFNTVLINYYRNGKDGVAWHADVEHELGVNPVIGSITFGQQRVFQLKHRFNKELKIITIPLWSGSFLIMKGKTQHFWFHQIPKTNKKLEGRINLTFRKII